MKHKKLFFDILLGFLLSISLLNESLAQTTFTITNTNDAGAGSLRQAILDANFTTNADIFTPDEIHFNLSGTGPFTISPTSALPTITDPIIIDGFSQPGASAGNLLIVINGANAPASTDGLTITTSGGGSTIQGLVINGFSGNGVVLQSNGNKLKGNFIGTDAAGTAGVSNGASGVFVNGASNTLIGGSVTGSGNLISGNSHVGILINNGGSNKIRGNKIGTNITGTAAIPNQDGIKVQNSAHNAIGGRTAAERNLISGNAADGIFLTSAGSFQDTIVGNYLGTDVTGTLDLGNGADGLSIGGGGHTNVIGGTTAAERNIISGNDRFGVFLIGTGTTGNRIIGNYIGTDVGGTHPVGNSSDGVLLYPQGGNIIGGTFAGEGNIIAYNGRAGVDVSAADNTSSNNNNPILRNSIFGNTGLGIDLTASGEADGLTPNDADDADVGANKLQNFPVITDVQVQGNGDVSVTYSVPSAVANSAYPLRIEFFISDGGQGRTFLSAQAYSSADAESPVTQTFTPNALVSDGDNIIATATSANGNTSEFSTESIAPLFSKQFSPDVITAAGKTTLIFTIDNTANILAATSLDFTDNLPAGVVIASPANASVVCTGGTLTAAAGSSTISYTGGTISAGASCTIQVDVTSASFGTYINTTGDLTSSLGNSGTAIDTLTVNRAGSYDIYAYNVTNGTNQRITFINDADEYNPSFAPGGMYIVHDVTGGSAALGHSLYITDISTGVSAPLTGGEGGNDASWSPDSMYIAFDRVPVGDQSIYIVPSTGGTPTLVRNNAVDAEWSNNSQRLVFQDVTDGSIRTVDLSGGSETNIVSAGANPSWSNNGKYIAYSDGNNIWKIKVKESGEPQGSPVQLTSDEAGIVNGQPSWSNNDKTILFHSNRTTGDFDIWTVSAIGGSPLLLTGNPVYGDYDPSYSKNGKYVAYAGFTLAASPKHSVNNKESAIISENSLPTDYLLEQNFPNPFNPSTVIRYALPENANVNLVVYDILGREIAKLVNGEVDAGYHQILFDGSKLSSGIYFYKLTSGAFIKINKMLLIK